MDNAEKQIGFSSMGSDFIDRVETPKKKNCKEVYVEEMKVEEKELMIQEENIAPAQRILSLNKPPLYQIKKPTRQSSDPSSSLSNSPSYKNINK